MFPSRIVCLTEETTETLYLLGEGERVVGISGYTVRPPEARQKPKVSSFLHARFEKIEALKPDLILAFSDLQADITTELVKRGLPGLHVQSTQRRRNPSDDPRSSAASSVFREKAESSSRRSSAGSTRFAKSASQLPRRPRVYFEEWDDPLIGGIRWTEELIEMAGGDPIFPEHRDASLAKDRIVTSEAVISRAPDIIIGSWCGKPVRKEKIIARPGWDQIPAVRDGQVYEVKSTYILQPGPAALTEGVRQVARIIDTWAARPGA